MSENPRNPIIRYINPDKEVKNYYKRFCDDCGEWYRPKGRTTRRCDDCSLKRQKQAILDRKKTFHDNKKNGKHVAEIRQVFKDYRYTEDNIIMSEKGGLVLKESF